jgi:hypothetical protein
VWDLPRPQQPPTARIAVALVGDEPRGRPRPPGRRTRMPSSTGSNCVLSWRCPGVITTESGRPLPSQARWNLVVSPPRLRPSPSSARWQQWGDDRPRRLRQLPTSHHGCATLIPDHFGTSVAYPSRFVRHPLVLQRQLP